MTYQLTLQEKTCAHRIRDELDLSEDVQVTVKMPRASPEDPLAQRGTVTFERGGAKGSFFHFGVLEPEDVVEEVLAGARVYAKAGHLSWLDAGA